MKFYTFSIDIWEHFKVKELFTEENKNHPFFLVFFSFQNWFSLVCFYRGDLCLYTPHSWEREENSVESSVLHYAILGALNQNLDTFAIFAEEVVKEKAQGMLSLVTNTQGLS